MGGARGGQGRARTGRLGRGVAQRLHWQDSGKTTPSLWYSGRIGYRSRGQIKSSALATSNVLRLTYFHFLQRAWFQPFPRRTKHRQQHAFRRPGIAMLLVALTVPTLLPAQASGPARCLQPERWRSRAPSASVAAAAAAAAAHGPVTVSSAAAAAEGGLAVADALRADGVVRVDGVLTPDMATELLGCVD